jgi:phosphatidylethanolamine-binding protein (PEBP) family uncharacterized protein
MNSTDTILTSRIRMAQRDAEDVSLGIGRMYCHWYICDVSALLSERNAAQSELTAARVRIEHLEAEIARWRAEVPT